MISACDLTAISAAAQLDTRAAATRYTSKFGSPTALDRLGPQDTSCPALSEGIRYENEHWQDRT